MFHLVAALALAAIGSAAPIDVSVRDTTCYSGVYIIGARGTGEAEGYGRTQSVVDGVVAAIPNSGAVALDYPASWASPLYWDSVTDGIDALKTLVEDYANNCDGKIVLVGFSQGGNVITDALAGGVAKPDPLDPSYINHISAITVFGDPTFTHGQTFDAGTDTDHNGIFSRGGDSLALLNDYAPKIRSYCDTNDAVCASGDSKSVHSAEVPTWTSDAIEFIVKLSS